MVSGKRKTFGNLFCKKFLIKNSKKQSKRKKTEEQTTKKKVWKSTRARSWSRRVTSWAPLARPLREVSGVARSLREGTKAQEVIQRQRDRPCGSRKCWRKTSSLIRSATSCSTLSTSSIVWITLKMLSYTFARGMNLTSREHIFSSRSWNRHKTNSNLLSPSRSFSKFRKLRY